MIHKIRMSALTRASETALLKKMDLPDLREMALLSSAVQQGLKGVCEFRKREDEMIAKYGFKVRR